MPRTMDFSGMDPGEIKNLSYGFESGQPTSPLAIGETVASVTFQISVISGSDPSPALRLIGNPWVQSDGLAVTQKVGTLQPGVDYEIGATAVTSAGQTLTPYSHLPCNDVS